MRDVANFKGVPRKVGRKLPAGRFTVGWKEDTSPGRRGPPRYLGALGGAQPGGPDGPGVCGGAASRTGREGLQGAQGCRDPPTWPPPPSGPGPPPLTPSRHTLSSLSAMVRGPGVRACRRPKLRERPGPAPASPGAAAGGTAQPRLCTPGGRASAAALRSGRPVACFAESPQQPVRSLGLPGATAAAILGRRQGHLTSPPTSAATFAARAGRTARGSQMGGRSIRGGASASACPPARPRLL